MTPRRLLLVLFGGVGAAGAAALLSPGSAHAATPTAAVAPVPVHAPPVRLAVPNAREAVRAIAGDAVRSRPPRPSGAPIRAVPFVEKVVEPALEEFPLTAVKDVVPIRVVRSDVTAPTSPDRVRSAPQGPTREPKSTWHSRANARATAPAATTFRSVHSSTAPSPANDEDMAFGARGAPLGVSVDGQTQSRGSAAVASIAAVARVANSRWSRFDFASARAPRPGIALDLAPPG